MRDEDLLRAECEKRGLPVSLEVLLRHLTNNHAAAIGAWKRNVELLEKRLAVRDAALREIEDEASSLALRLGLRETITLAEDIAVRAREARQSADREHG